MKSPNLRVQRRDNALKALLFVTIPGALVFCGLNLEAGAIALAAANMVLVVFTVGVLLTRLHVCERRTVAIGYILILLGTVVWALTKPDIHPTASTWIPVFPLLAYLLLDVNRAFWLSSASLLGSVAAFLYGAYSAPQQLNALGLADVVVPIIGAFIVCHFYSRSQTVFDAQMQERIGADSLTGLGNRHKLQPEFDRERQRAERTGAPLSMILIDLDHFKDLNDTYGHDAGDAALVFVSRLLSARSRETDLMFRIGGEEFVLLLPNTNKSGAAASAEDLRATLEKNVFCHAEDKIRMTLSAGVAELGPDGTNWPELFRAADRRLYASKARGRNCVGAE